MKSVNLLAIIAIVLVVAIVAGVLIIFAGDRSEAEMEAADVLDCASETALRQFIEQEKVLSYQFDTDACHLANISVLGVRAYSVEFSFAEEQTAEIVVHYSLFQCISENITEEEAEDFDVMSYQFTQEDKAEIQAAFDSVKGGLERKLGCTLSQYDLIPTQEGIEIEDNEDLFYQGLLIREYSVRDRDGVIWLLRLEASYGTADATLIKVVDDSAYEGFIPAVDLTRQ